MRRFYDSNISNEDETFILSETESKHVVRVLRMKEGDQLEMVNGKGGLFTCEITTANPKKCHLSIVDKYIAEAPKKTIHIAIGPTKQLDRLEWFIEKATEIGVDRITLIESKNAERQVAKLDRLEKKAVSALKQSKRLFKPKLDSLTKFKSFINDYPNGLLAHCYDGDKSTISETFNDTQGPILIGPEGDFTPEEVELAREAGYISITLGNNRLRTETAGLYACMEAKLSIR